MDLCGININCPNGNVILHNNDSCKILVTVNAEAIVRAQKDQKLAEIIEQNFASIDGQIPLWLYRIKHPKSKINKISGSDFIYTVSEWASINHKRVFLLGGKEKSNEESCVVLKKKYPDLKINGFSPKYAPYPFSNEDNNRILDVISSYKPDVLFVGFGMGKQEYWAYDNLDALKNVGVKLIIGCGGTFEFVSGAIKRAPKYIQNIGLESFWRLFQEFRWFRIKRVLLSFGIFYYFLFPKVSKSN